MDDVRKIAKRALEILDQDGWNKGFVTMPEVLAEVRFESRSLQGYRAGSHCIGGAWNLAANGVAWRWTDYAPLAEAIQALNLPPDMAVFGCTTELIAAWNNVEYTTEADVRNLLESMAAG